ncbi:MULTISPECIES: hypothetical protein [Streptomyces]|jgi:hypothetical protein|uniref:hypothetical protein n=1 Tax=Streptomyces TaxID=1883 RepID=UPI0028DC73C8|nr:hypothetical protein [Streptomyces sp. DSM 40976]
MWTNVHYTGSLGANASVRLFTYGWPASWHVVWYLVPTNPQAGAPQVDWDVAVERYEAGYVTYWITVKNLTAATMTYEARYAVLN